MISMYLHEGRRVIIFTGCLFGKMAVYDGEPGWNQAFELARQLGIEIQRIYGYTGSIAC